MNKDREQRVWMQTMSVLNDLHRERNYPLSSGRSSLTLFWKEHFLSTISSFSSDETTAPFNLLLPQLPVIKLDIDPSLANQHKRAGDTSNSKIFRPWRLACGTGKEAFFVGCEIWSFQPP